MNTLDTLLEAVAKSPAIASKLKKLAGKKPEQVTFANVAPAAQPFLAGLLARKVKQSLWFVCANVRTQEMLHNDLLVWSPDALFLPELEAAAMENALPDPEIQAEQLAVLQSLQSDRRKTVVLVKDTLEGPAPAPESLVSGCLRLVKSTKHALDVLANKLGAAGYERMPLVSARGQFAVRGGILDVFSWQQMRPVRVEFFDDEIESIREFDLNEQTSIRTLDEVEILLGEGGDRTATLRDYVQPGDLLVNVDCELADAQISMVSTLGEEDDGAGFFEPGIGEFGAGDFVIEEAARMRFFDQLREWQDWRWRVTFFCFNEGEQERFRGLLAENKIDAKHFHFALGGISRGFIFPERKIAVLSDAEIFGRYRNARSQRLSSRRAQVQASRTQVDFSELNEGDFVVHLEHGIAKYRGLQRFEHNGVEQDMLTLEFADEARLYVPIEQGYLVSRYVGVGKRIPPLSALGDAKWAKAKKLAERAVFDYAHNLLSIHAARETSLGHAFPQDNKWQGEFESSFRYKETPDQLTSIAATKADMESEQPMDRLICGDVGFGKTEVAIRAAFKAVMGGKQVAILVPTTVLAQQHFQNFRERMSDYPIKVEMLSRFRTPAQAREVLAGLADGSIDIVTGTHRLISKDVKFKDLGLVVIDEEQRFGVLHKEKFKELFKLVDVLTLSATPIPRTLYLSLMGAKDMSVIETAPQNRLPVETIICPYDERIIRDAIKRELHRQGQVYFLHNRVESIERIAARIRLLVPGARIDIGHGQMGENELEPVMQRFVNGETDVLISTTIIESGLDIPNANTIIIDRADRFGLADLYQLRGRVGRAQHKAYAYLMLPRELLTTGEARKRINAIKQYSNLGAGFKIAMRDLEIRGAGNVLGTAQSGHIVTVGFDLYCQLLKQAVAKLKGEKVKPRLDVFVRLDFVDTNEADYSIADRTAPTDERKAPAFLPGSYIPEPRMRIQAYRKLAEVTTHEQVDAIKKTWRDRFGPLPDAAANLLTISRIQLAAARAKITRVEARDGKLMLTRGGDYVLLDGKFPRLTSNSPELRLTSVFSLIQKF